MDAAKLASVLVTDDYGVKELLDNPGMAQKCVPIVLIPTTAGTGAEVTPNAIVAVPGEGAEGRHRQREHDRGLRHPSTPA